MRYSIAHLQRWWTSTLYWVREFYGENAYARYVADWHARHGRTLVPSGEHRLLSQREFFARQVETRFGGAVQRCC